MKILKTIRSNEAAEILGIKDQTLKDWRFKGIGPPFFRSGRRVMYIYEDVLKFIESNRAA